MSTTDTLRTNRISCDCSHCKGAAALVADTTWDYLQGRTPAQRKNALHGFVTLAQSPLGRMQAARNAVAPLAI